LPWLPTTRREVSPILQHARRTSDCEYMQNGLQLNPDKSEALIIGTTAQLHAVASAVSSVAVARNSEILLLACLLTHLQMEITGLNSNKTSIEQKTEKPYIVTVIVASHPIFSYSAAMAYQ